MQIEIIFWCCLLLIAISYLLYPLFIVFYSKIKPLRLQEEENYCPTISIIIAAYNEELVLEETIENFLQLEYPKEKIEIIIGSDCSTDKTNEIIKKLENKYPDIIRGIIFNQRRGKSIVLNDLVKEAKNDILVFSDANTIYQKNALKEMLKYYKDEKVGGVSGRLILLNSKEAEKAGNKENVYWDFETQLKIAEGKLGILIGANGGIYSIRKFLYDPIPDNIPVTDDLFISLTVLLKKYYLLYEKNATAIEYNAPDINIEHKRKIRFNKSNIKSLVYLYKLLSPKYGLASFSFFAHKIIRWLSPILFIIIFISNLLILENNLFYKIFFILQIIFYFLSFMGYILNKLKINISIFSLPYYFTLIHLGLLKGLLQALFTKGTGVWEPTKRVKNNN